MSVAQDYVNRNNPHNDGYLDPGKIVIGEHLARAIYGPLKPHLGQYEFSFERRLEVAMKSEDGFFGYDMKLGSKIFIYSR